MAGPQLIESGPLKKIVTQLHGYQYPVAIHSTLITFGRRWRASLCQESSTTFHARPTLFFVVDRWNMAITSVINKFVILNSAGNRMGDDATDIWLGDELKIDLSMSQQSWLIPRAVELAFVVGEIFRVHLWV